MKLIFAIVSNDDANDVIKALYKEKFQTTKLATTGGFLSKGNTTLITGVSDEEVDRAITIIGNESKKHEEYVPGALPFDSGEMLSSPIKITVGGATIFVINVEQFLKL